ncbi:MAG TPA: HAD-IIA family hydrolase [archaeon]|nr:HAD-IIA family hydrolase [archaeon]
MDFSNFDTFIFDLDGTIWEWDNLFPGVKETIRKLKLKGKKILFVSNNTFFSRSRLTKKLNDLGIKTEKSDVINSGYATSMFIKGYYKNPKVMAVGKGVAEDLQQAKIKVVQRPPADIVVVGQDHDFSMEKLAMIYRTINENTHLIAAARGKYFPTKKGMLPGAGLILEMIESMTNVKAKITGKPSDFMCYLVKSAVNSDMSKVLFVGDELDSDIMTGKKLGCKTCLVKTGVWVEGDDADVKPDFVIDSVANINV